VLIVDDNVDHLAFLRVAVSARYRVATAANGFEAYELACQVRPDAILLDLVMPVVDGYTVVRKLRQNPTTAQTPIIFVTGLDADALDPLPAMSAVLRMPCRQGEILGSRPPLRSSSPVRSCRVPDATRVGAGRAGERAAACHRRSNGGATVRISSQSNATPT